uniref:Uncharacterized protein n=1 Tax=Anopheles maculatus TaxID=74869 RepID=A0A182SQD9_9DIPT
MEVTVELETEQNCTCIQCSTVRCDFSFMNRNLSLLELLDFVEFYLYITPDAIERMQWNTTQRCLYLRVKNSTMATHLMVLHNKRHVYPPGRSGSRVELTRLDMPTEVIVHDLSELVTDDQVRASLGQYGVVMTIAHSRWSQNVTYAGIPSGHRLVQMVIQRPIPRTLRIANELAGISYSGQQRGSTRLVGWLSRAAVNGLRRFGRFVRAYISQSAGVLASGSCAEELVEQNI